MPTKQMIDRSGEVGGDKLTEIRQEGSKKVTLTTGYKGFTLRPREGMLLFRAVMRNPVDQINEDFIQLMVDMVEAGNFPQTAAATLGIPEMIWEKWWDAGCRLIMMIKDDPDSINLMNDEEERIVTLVANITRAVAENERALVSRIEFASRFDWSAGAWLLSKLQPEKWGKRRDQPEQIINNNVNVNTGVLAVAPQQPKDQWLESFKHVKLVEAIDVTNGGTPPLVTSSVPPIITSVAQGDEEDANSNNQPL